MEYTLDEFNELILKVQEEGGALDTTPCEGEMVPYTINDRPAPIMSCHCGNESIFVVPYHGEKGEDRLAHICAVCDDVGAMARFEIEVS